MVSLLKAVFFVLCYPTFADKPQQKNQQRFLKKYSNSNLKFYETRVYVIFFPRRQNNTQWALKMQQPGLQSRKNTWAPGEPRQHTYYRETNFSFRALAWLLVIFTNNKTWMTPPKTWRARGASYVKGAKFWVQIIDDPITAACAPRYSVALARYFGFIRALRQPSYQLIHTLRQLPIRGLLQNLKYNSIWTLLKGSSPI